MDRVRRNATSAPSAYAHNDGNLQSIGGTVIGRRGWGPAAGPAYIIPADADDGHPAWTLPIDHAAGIGTLLGCPSVWRYRDVEVVDLYIYIFISPQMVDNKQYEKKNKNKQK